MFFGQVIFGRGRDSHGHVLMSWRAKSIQSGAAVCNRKRLFPQPQQAKENDLGEREIRQLSNVVKQCHRPQDTTKKEERNRLMS